MERWNCEKTMSECDDDLCMHASDGTTYRFGNQQQRMAFQLMMMMDKDLADLIVGFIDLGVSSPDADSNC